MSRIVLLGVAGIGAAWLLALAFGDSPAAATEVVALAVGAALALSSLGLMVTHHLGQRRLSVYLWVAALTTVLGIVAGTVLAGSRMFLSPKDERTVIVVLVAAATVSGLTAIVLAKTLRRGIGALSHLASSLGHRPHEPAGPPVPTLELGDLASQLREIGEQLHESIVRERSLEESRRELVAWISHDLRTPMAGIQALTEALEDGVVTDPETVSRYYRTISSEVARLDGMVDDLFRLSRIHSGLLNLNLELVSLYDVVSDALMLVRPMANAKGVHVVGHVDEDSAKVRLSTTEFLRIMRNLLENALRHTPAGGEVTVQAHASDHETIMTVRDGCGGIAKADLARVFELGYRGDAARSPEPGKRAGLGLAIAQGLVQAHGGDIEVVNETGGCCFTVRLPMAAA
jgi:signal transduction histidine kinase